MAGNLEEQIQSLANIVGADYVKTELFERVNYADTGLPYDVEEGDLPDIVVHPGNTQEVAEVLKYANQHKIPVTTYGSGTSLIFGTKPKHRGITLSTKRLNFLQIEEGYQWFECGAGVTIGQISTELEKRGYCLPINVGSRLQATIGGAVSANTCGHLMDYIFGKPVSNALGIEVVLPTGEIIQTGSKTIRRATGWDLTRIFVGAEGILGVITKIRMAFYPKPETVDTVAFFRTAEEIGNAFSLMLTKKLPPIMDGEFASEKCCKVGYEAYGLDFPKGAMAITQSMGRTKEDALKYSKEMEQFFKSVGATESFVLEDPKVRTQVWGVRENAMRWGQEKGLKGYLAIEVNPPLPFLKQAITELNHITEGRNDLIGQTEAYLYGHIGASSLHCLFAFPYSWSTEQMKQVVREIWKVEKDLNIKYDGVGGDWGQLPYRVPFYREKYGEVSYGIIKKMKQLFDPNNILNRGNLEGEE
jgi:glycolate dehydrogenase FAD-linked subunit